jgi:hypothetical protein
MSRLPALSAVLVLIAVATGVTAHPAAAGKLAPPPMATKKPPSHHSRYPRHARRRRAVMATASATATPWHGEQWVDCDNDYGYDELAARHPAVGILPGAPYGARQSVAWEPVYFQLVSGVWKYAGEGPWSYTTASSVYTWPWTDAGNRTLGQFAPPTPVAARNTWRVAARIYWYATTALPSSSYYGWIESHHTMWSPHRMIDMGMNDIDSWGSSCYLP